MILGIGSDIMNTERISKIVEEYGERFIGRCFAPEERERVETVAKGNLRLRALGYAKRWAAKEACAKALGLGIREDVFLKDIIVINDSKGKPDLVLKAGAKDRLSAITPKGLSAKIHVSLSDDPPVAFAFVVISAESK